LSHSQVYSVSILSDNETLVHPMAERSLTTNLELATAPTDDVSVEDDWGLPLDLNLFAHQERHRIVIHEAQASPVSIFIECVEALTPVDMMSLSSGTNDATGFRVWTGAVLLIASLDTLVEDFKGKRVLELGCGTGIGGIALMLSQHATPAFLCFSDADQNALKLCRRNCELNGLEEVDERLLQNLCSFTKKSFSIMQLTWGTTIPSTIPARSMDTVVATDILYDIEMLSSILQTTMACLKPGGSFVLSHIPRASCPEHHQPDENLESFIVQQAELHGLVLRRLIRPRDVSSFEDSQVFSDTLDTTSLRDMEAIGAAILVFHLVVVQKNHV
jgi:ribosomal protein L11 methylase PrmA